MSGKAIQLPMQMQTAALAVPAGRWGIGLSGGADSVALFRMIECRPDIQLVAIHLDHQLRGQESAGDAEFVRELSCQHGVKLILGTREQLQGEMDKTGDRFTHLSSLRNKSALYRAMRLKLFANTLRQEQLQGILLAHHADDQAETVLMRLLRGSSPRGLGAMAMQARVRGVNVCRPLLKVRREDLRQWLVSIGQDWREDSSNAKPIYARNRIRQWLASREDLTDSLSELADAMRHLRLELLRQAPRLPNTFELSRLWDLPRPVAAEACRLWLIQAGCPAEMILPRTLDQLLLMANDLATAPRQDFPGQVQVIRRQGMLASRVIPPKPQTAHRSDDRAE